MPKTMTGMVMASSPQVPTQGMGEVESGWKTRQTPMMERHVATNSREREMSMQTQPGINVTVEVKDGNPTIAFNSHGRSYSTDKMVTGKLMQACINAKGFPKADKITSVR